MVRAFVVALAVLSLAPAATSRAPQNQSDLGGRWTLDRRASQMPAEVGFDVDWGTVSGSGGSSGGGRGRRGGGGGSVLGTFPVQRESEDDAARLRQLTDEVQAPSTRLTISDTPAAVMITDDRGRARVFHPNGQEETLQLERVPVEVTSSREAGRLVVLYHVEQGRTLRYTYARDANGALSVDVQFLQRGHGQEVRRVYEPASPDEAMAVPTPEPPRQTPAPALPTSTPPLLPSADRILRQPVNERPGAALQGLTRLGVVVEDLSPQAAACGLTHSALQAAIAKHLTDAGFTVGENSDESTYMYVNVMTTALPGGLCVSRYDVALNSNTSATLDYQRQAVPVEVSLLHTGGLSGSAAASHGADVLREVLADVDQFATQIHEADKPR